MNRMFTKEQQKINRAEEQRRKKAVLEEKRRKGRCFIIGKFVMDTMPDLADGSEEKAMEKLQRIFESFDENHKRSR